MPGCDRISELPESLQTRILSYLPTKDSVKTSVLSTRWKNLWLNVPGLDLDCHDFPYEDYQVLFINFIDRFLEFNPESRLQKFKVKYSREEIYGLKDRIGTAVNRGIQHLDLESSTYYRDDNDSNIYPCIDFMPLNLYTSKTLVFLKLSYSGLEDPGFVSMPCLKFMDLTEIRWRDPMNLEKLISGCPVLEELTLLRDIHDELAVTRLISRSLKRFYVPHEYEYFSSSRVEYTLEIDAPGLEYMSLKEDHFDRILVKNLTCLFTIDLDINFLVQFGRIFHPQDLSKRNEISNFLTGISSVRHMIISQRALEAFDHYSKLAPIPKFKNLSRLQAAFPSTLLQFLPAFLESCPNLKHLILNFDSSKAFQLKTVPWCFLWTLECVEIKGIWKWEEDEIQVVSYFLENSSVLKKLSLSFVGYPLRDPDSNIYQELDKLKKRSPTCQIICEC